MTNLCWDQRTGGTGVTGEFCWRIWSDFLFLSLPEHVPFFHKLHWSTLNSGWFLLEPWPTPSVKSCKSFRELWSGAISNLLTMLCSKSTSSKLYNLWTVTGSADQRCPNMKRVAALRCSKLYLLNQILNFCMITLIIFSSTHKRIHLLFIISWWEKQTGPQGVDVRPTIVCRYTGIQFNRLQVQQFNNTHPEGRKAGCWENLLYYSNLSPWQHCANALPM